MRRRRRDILRHRRRQGDILLNMKNWSSTSDDGKALHNVDLCLRAGEIHAILSAYANDEWALLHLFTNPITSCSGACTVLGQDVGLSGSFDSRIQLVGTIPAVSKSISVLENIYLSPRMPRFFTDAQILPDCMELMASCGLYVDLRKPLYAMTSDELRRIELLHICAIQPEIVIFVDTITLLEEETRKRMPSVLNWLRERNCGILYFTSILEDALGISERISIFDNGSVARTFLTSEVQKDPREAADILSGWRALTQSESSVSPNRVLKAAAGINDVILADYELRHVLESILRDVGITLHAKGSRLYILDNNEQNILEIADKCENQRLGSEEVLSFLQKGTAVTLVKDDPEFQALFPVADDVQQAYFYPILLEGGKQLLLQILFHEVHDASERLNNYIQMFVKEISVSIETSRLLGKSVLLQESHHRIKNNLQMIVNLLYLQRTPGITESDRYVNSILDEAINQTKSIAYVHTLLSRDWYGKNVVNLKSIVVEIAKLYRMDGLDIELDLADLTLPYNNAISLSLVINELINNCIKHAFTDDDTHDLIFVKTENTGADVRITVRDNGTGVRRDFMPERAQSVGLSIITSIVSSLQGEVRYGNCPDMPGSRPGTEVSISFPKPNLMPLVAKNL